MTSYARLDYQRLIVISRDLQEIGSNSLFRNKTVKRRCRKYAEEIFKMCETALGEQYPPLVPPKMPLKKENVS